MVKNFTVSIEWEMLKKDFMREMGKCIRKMHNQFYISEYKEYIHVYQDEIINTFKSFLNIKHCLMAQTGTQALMIAMRSVGVKNGDEVITTVYTGIPTISAIRLIGAKPIFVDVKKDTWNIDEDKIEEKITNKTKAILPVDMLGNPCNYDKINEIGKKYNIPIVEDLCQAFTAEYHEKKLGNVGCDIACTSFGSGKTFGTMGQGGAIFTNNDKLAKMCESMIDYGSDDKNNCVSIGYSGDIDFMEIIYLYCKLKYLKNNLQYRNNIINIYKRMKNVEWQKQEPNSISAWCKPQVIFKDKHSLNVARQFFELDDFFSYDICDNEIYNYGRKDTPISNYISHKTIGLPMYPFINEKIINNAVNDYNLLV